MTALETARLRLDPWAPEHGELLAAWSALPAITRYVGDGSTWTPEKAAQRSASQLEHWARHGFGWRIAVRRDTGDPVGLMALNLAPPGTEGVATTEHEIGWWLDPGAWGQGYAREGAAAMRDEAFERLRAPWVMARISPANAASRAVAEAIGLRYERDSVADPGIPVVLYRRHAAAR